VTPILLAAQLLQVLLQQRTHLDDPVRHALDFAEPLLVERGVVEDLGCDARPVNRGVGVEGSHEDLDLRVDALLLLGGFADDGECAYTFAVETLDVVLVSVCEYDTGLSIPCS